MKTGERVLVAVLSVAGGGLEEDAEADTAAEGG